MKKLALFDLDGTLFNTNDVNYFAYNEALNENGYSIDYEYYCSYCNGRHYKVFLSDILNNNDKIIESVHNRKKELYSKYLDKAIVNEHLFNIIELIRSDYNIGLVTTASKKNTYDILNHFNKLDLFDLILTHNDIEKPKPSPEGYNKAINYFNVLPKDTIIFEDALVGIEAARKTGSNVIIIDRFYGDVYEKD